MDARQFQFDAVRPRDVALVLLEALTADPDARTWLLERVATPGGSDGPRLLAVRDSGVGVERPDADDESSATVSISLEAGNRRLCVILAVAFDRPGVVADRLEAAREANTVDERKACRTVLVAPGAALADDATAGSAVDATIALESLRDRVAGREGDRDAFRTALLAAAIDAGRVTSPTLERYRALAADTHAALEVSPADTRTGTTTLEIEAPTLARNHRLVHVLEDGHVDLRIPDGASRLRAFAARYAGDVPPTAALLAEEDALVIRESVPAIDPTEADPEAAIEAGIAAVDRLRSVSELVADRSG